MDPYTYYRTIKLCETRGNEIFKMAENKDACVLASVLTLFWIEDSKSYNPSRRRSLASLSLTLPGTISLGIMAGKGLIYRALNAELDYIPFNIFF